MRIQKKEKKKKVFVCPICGHEEKVDVSQEKPVDLVPADIREEEKIKAGVVKDKKVAKITIDEDTIKEVLELLKEGKE